MWSLDLAEILQNGVHHLEGLVYFLVLVSMFGFFMSMHMTANLSNFGTCQDDLARHKDQQDDLRFDHTIDETREQLGLIRAEIVMTRRKSFQTNGKLDVT
jgi:hypothetical protein